MKHLKLFFALFAMLALGVGNAWAEEVSLSDGTFANSKITWTAASGNITITQSKGSSGTAVSSSYVAAPRVYKGHILSFEAKEGYKIKQIDIKCNSTYYGNSMTAGTVINGTTVTNNTAEVNRSWTTSSNGTHVVSSVSPDGLSAIHIQNVATTNVQLRITAIEITYVEGTSTPTTTYTIKWHTAKGVTTDVTLNEGATITKPATDPAMTGYKFMGWTEDCAVASDGAGFTAISNFGTATENKDYYAVFAVATTTSGEGSSNYEKVTSNLADWAGDYLIAYNNTTFADGRTGGTSGMGAQNKKVDLSSNISNNTIPASVGDQYNVTLEAVTGGYVLKTKDGKYNYQSSNANGLATTTSISTASQYAIKVTFTSENDIKLALSGGANGAVFRYNTDGYFRFYKNGGQSAVYLYKKVAGGSTTTYSDYITTCASDIEYIELGDAFKWSATEADVTIDATDNVFPTLTNTHNVPVKYSSSDDAIATIAADGTVTLKTEGTVTITAKYEGGTSAGTGKEYKSKTVTYSLKVNKAVAQPTGTMYVKVTDAVTDGEYLIVYETGNVAFNGALPALDAVSNTIAVEINSNTIAGNTEIDAATFTIASMTDGHSIQSKSGKYIGRTSNSNGMDTGNSAIANVITFSNGAVKIAGSENGSTTSLQYNAASGQTRFRYFATTQKAIALYKKVDPNAVVEPVFQLAAGEYYGTQSVEITCATTGAEIYYTLNGTDPTSASTKYTGAISIASTTTVKAIAVKGANSSAVVSATYTILTPLATMQEIFDKARAVGNTATPVHITMNNWVITGVKGSNAYLTDGTKGLIIYTASHGFNVGDILSGTVACKVQLYKGSAELTELTSTTEGLTVSTGGVVTPVVVNDVTTLGGVNTGSVIKVTGPCTVNGTKYYVAGLELYNSLFAYTNPEAGFNYECTGVYVQFDATQEILPRKAEDLVKIETQQPAGIAFAVAELTAEVGATDFEEPELTNPNSLTVTYKTSDATLATVDATTGEVTIGNKAGKVTITASFAGSDDYVAANASYNITITDPNQLEATFVAGTNKSDTKSISKNGITVEFADGSFSRDDNYRCYAGKSMTISYADGNITKIVIECTANDGAEYGPGQFTTETATYSYSGKVGTWIGEAKSVTFTNIKQVRMTTITVYYKKDNRQETGIAWNPETINLTVGDAFTPPTFNNPNGLSGITFASSNEALATVNNAGAITLVSGKTGTATITATFADGHADYKPAEATCVITVSPKSEKVVILAEYNGQWYALKAAYLSEKTDRLDAIPVNYVGGKLYNVAEADKASIEWSSVVEGDKVSFLNDGKYLKGKTTTTLLFEEDADGLYQWDNTTYTMTIGTTVRSFLYNGEAFRNFAVSNAGRVVDGVLYSSLPVVTAPEYATAIEIGSGNNTTVIEANKNQKVNVIVDRAFEAGDEWYTLCVPFNMPASVIGKAYQISGLVQKTADYVEVYLAEKTTIVAGEPYLIKPTVTVDKFVVENATIVNTTGASISKSISGLYVTMQGVINGNGTTDGLYWVGNGGLLYNDTASKSGLRAYFNITTSSGIAPRMRVVAGENVETGIEDIITTDTPVKVIENGQLIIIRDGVKYNVQGQRL